MQIQHLSTQLNKYIAKCQVLEEMLQNYHTMESDLIDLQHRHIILQKKYDKLQFQNKFQEDVSSVQSTKELTYCSDRIEIYELYDYGTSEQIRKMKREMQFLDEVIVSCHTKYSELEFKYQQDIEKWKYQCQVIQQHTTTANQESLTKEVNRLNNIISNLRYTLEKYDTRIYEEELLKDQLWDLQTKSSKQSIMVDHCKRSDCYQQFMHL